MILSDFQKVLMGKTIVTCLYFMFSYNPELNVMFVLSKRFVSATGRIDAMLTKSYLNQVNKKIIHINFSYGYSGFFQY